MKIIALLVFATALAAIRSVRRALAHRRATNAYRRAMWPDGAPGSTKQ